MERLDLLQFYSGLYNLFGIKVVRLIDDKPINNLKWKNNDNIGIKNGKESNLCYFDIKGKVLLSDIFKIGIDFEKITWVQPLNNSIRYYWKYIEFHKPVINFEFSYDAELICAEFHSDPRIIKVFPSIHNGKICSYPTLKTNSNISKMPKKIFEFIKNF